MNTSTTTKKRVEIDGILIPHTWSPRNRVLEVSVQGLREKEYIIDSRNKKGKELKKLLGKRVFLKGYISPQKIEPRKLLVLSYKILEW